MSGPHRMTPDEIAGLAHYAAAKGLSHLSYSQDGFLLDLALVTPRVVKAASPSAPVGSKTVNVKATTPGRVQFLREFQVSDAIGEGEIVALVEVDGARFPVVSGVSGRVAKVDATNHQLVGYGTSVLTLVPQEA
jgi:biotin carboxyl carrier protein